MPSNYLLAAGTSALLGATASAVIASTPDLRGVAISLPLWVLLALLLLHTEPGMKWSKGMHRAPKNKLVLFMHKEWDCPVLAKWNPPVPDFFGFWSPVDPIISKRWPWVEPQRGMLWIEVPQWDATQRKPQ